MSNNLISFFGVDRQYISLKDEILDVTDKVLSTGKVLDGDYTFEFERAMAKRCQREYAISVNSCTQGLLFALQSRDPERDIRGILIPAISFVATLNTALLANEYVALCDVDFGGLMDLGAMRDSLRAHVDTIMYANLWGNTVDYDRFRVMSEFFGSDDMFIIEDAAQSFGASYKGIPSGKMGTVSVLSFDPTKNLNNYGSGGMVLTDDAYIADCIRNFKDNGKSSGHEMLGVNSKMSEVDCAQMLVKLDYFDAWQRRRTEIANYYIDQFGTYVDILPTTEGTVHAWSKFAFRVSSRSQLRQHLLFNGIDSKIHYSRALFDEVMGQGLLDPVVGSTWEASQFTKESLSLPIYPELTDGEVEHIAQTVKDFYVR